MKYFLLTSFLAAAVAAIPKELEGRTGCADNCGRAVEAGRFGDVVKGQHIDECKAYLLVTTTPVAKTVYVTKSIPAYASPCSGEARYLTACACLGATPVTVEAPTPTVTSTVTI